MQAASSDETTQHAFDVVSTHFTHHVMYCQLDCTPLSIFVPFCLCGVCVCVCGVGVCACLLPVRLYIFVNFCSFIKCI